MPKILVTGANGQLGQEFRVLASQMPDSEWLFLDRAALDISQASQVQAIIEAFQPAYCFNAAAYTAVDKAETEPDLAYGINAHGAANVAEACRAQGVQLFHFSTDYVYAPALNRPIREDDPTDPQGVYAASKLAGDEAVQRILPEACVLRTSWVYSSFGHNFVRTMLRLGSERSQLRVVFDQVGSPTYARHLAAACLALAQQHCDGKLSAAQLGGVFHYSNQGVCSWYDFAVAIFELAGLPCTVSPIESHDYPTPAQRPHYSVLNKHKFTEAFQLPIAHWRSALQECLKEMELVKG